jgi:hypothetical protein
MYILVRVLGLIGCVVVGMFEGLFLTPILFSLVGVSGLAFVSTLILPWLFLTILTMKYGRPRANSSPIYDCIFLTLSQYCFFSPFLYPSIHTLESTPLDSLGSYFVFPMQWIKLETILWWLSGGFVMGIVWLILNVSIEDLETSMKRDIETFFETTGVVKVIVKFVIAYVVIICFYSILYDSIDTATGRTAFNKADMTIIDFIYFSTVTITTVGYGDYYPTHPGSRIAVVTELLVGVIILATYLGAAISFYGRRPAAPTRAADSAKLEPPAG